MQRIIATKENTLPQSGLPDHTLMRGLNSKPSPLPHARVIDLCCGLGGLSLAATELGMHVVGGVDHDSNALKTFMRNFPQTEVIAGSVRSSKVMNRCKELFRKATHPHSPRIVISGPPCQGFSAAGSRDPKDLRNKVLIAVARAITALKPDCALIENVSTVLSEKYDTRMKKFEEVLAGSKYHVLRLVLDASEFGVPQKRKRAFLLVTRKRLNESDVTARLRDYNLPAAKVEDVLSGLPTPAIRPDDYRDEIDYGCKPNHLAMQHSRRVIAKIANIEPGKGPMSYRKLHPTRLSNTLFSGHRAPPAHFREPRSITVREAARLQGFPDSFRIYGSFSNQMMQVTNAVPPPLARAVLRVLLEVTSLGTPQNAEPR